MSQVFIGLGANVGNRRENIKKAIRKISELANTSIVKKSSFYETVPEGITDQPDFINAVIEINTSLKPPKLLIALKKIEQELGRVERERWRPREIDLDILTYDHLILEEPGLKIPHPLMHQRKFVLEPLCEIAPDKVHSLMKKTFKELYNRINHEN